MIAGPVFGVDKFEITDNYFRTEGKDEIPFREHDDTYDERLARGFHKLEDIVSGYKDDVLNEKLLRGLAKRYPKLISLQRLGKTHLGREILAIRIAKGKNLRNRPAILLTGSHHASEMTSTEHCYRIIYALLKYPKKYATMLANHTIWVVPLVNPDGAFFFWNVSTKMGRKNGYLAAGQDEDSLDRGVDLNRNYPFRWNSGNPKASSDKPDNFYYRGPSAGSEPETQAMIRLARREHFVYAISFHSKAGRLLFPYTIDDVENPEPDYARELAFRLASRVDGEEMRRGFKAVRNLYSVDGTDQDYYYHEHGTLAYIFETNYENCEYELVHEYMNAYDRLIADFLGDYSTAHKFVIRVMGRNGKPVAARIKFSDQAHFEKEIWRAHPKTGIFFRLTSSPLAQVATITAKGYRTKKVRLRPKKSAFPQPVIVRLNRANR